MLKIRNQIGFAEVSRKMFWDVRNLMASEVPIFDCNMNKASYRCLPTLFRKLAGCGLLLESQINHVRLQIDGHASRTSMGVETINAFICLSHHKTKVGVEGEYHVAAFKGAETPEQFRKNFKNFVDALCDLVRSGLVVEDGENSITYRFKLLLCSDYAAMFKLLACGHWCAHYRCAICFFDARRPNNEYEPRDYTKYRSSFRTSKLRKWSKEYEPMVNLDPQHFDIVPDLFHMKLNIARSILTKVHLFPNLTTL